MQHFKKIGCHIIITHLACENVPGSPHHGEGKRTCCNSWFLPAEMTAFLREE